MILPFLNPRQYDRPDGISIQLPPSLENQRMDRLTRILIGIVAVLHGAFFVVELFLWQTLAPKAGLYTTQAAEEAAKHAPRFFDLVAALGRNCGLYNGILAGTFVWLLAARDLNPRAARSLATYLLVAVVVA